MMYSLDMNKIKVVIVSIICAIGFSACLPAPTPWTPVEGPAIAYVGDSITYAAEHGGGLDNENEFSYLTDLMSSRGYSTSISAMIGATTEDLKTLEFDAPDMIVVALGTNDMHDGARPVAEAVQNVVDFLDRHNEQCSVVVNVAETAPWQLDVYGAEYNAALDALDAERDDLVVFDWGSHVAANPHLVREDGVHGTEAGQEAYRLMLAEAPNHCSVDLP